VLRKQLHSGDARFQRIGVIGSVALVCQLAPSDSSYGHSGAGFGGAGAGGGGSTSAMALAPTSLQARALAQAQQHVEAVLAVARDCVPLQVSSSVPPFGVRSLSSQSLSCLRFALLAITAFLHPRLVSVMSLM
jgi:hypothetical protein